MRPRRRDELEPCRRGLWGDDMTSERATTAPSESRGEAQCHSITITHD